MFWRFFILCFSHAECQQVRRDPEIIRCDFDHDLRHCSIGVEDEQIICLTLDDDENIQYRNPLELGKYIRSMTTDESKTY